MFVRSSDGRGAPCAPPFLPMSFPLLLRIWPSAPRETSPPKQCPVTSAAFGMRRWLLPFRFIRAWSKVPRDKPGACLWLLCMYEVSVRGSCSSGGRGLKMSAQHSVPPERLGGAARSFRFVPEAKRDVADEAAGPACCLSASKITYAVR